jgi:hypothetical protein
VGGQSKVVRCCQAITVVAALCAACGFVPAYGAADDRNTASVRRHTARPNPRLADLADNTALDLGRYECASRAPHTHCDTIFDFSRINYDPVSHRMLLFGGGHAASGRTDVDTFDLTNLRWQSLYPTMTCEEIQEQDIDPRGFHRKSGHPVARHRYDQNVIAEVNGRPAFMIFSTEGFRGACHSYDVRIRGVAWLPLDAVSSGWQYSPERRLPWGYAGAAEFDPISKMVVLTGGQGHGLWIYDPSKQEVVATHRLNRPSNASNLLYFPPNGNMYLIDSKTGEVLEFELNRKDWSATVVRKLETTGDKPGAMRNFAYDKKNKIIGGFKAGKFYAFDPLKREWRSEQVRVASDDGVDMGPVSDHAIDYDDVNNVFIFVSKQRPARRTWAYRFRR